MPGQISIAELVDLLASADGPLAAPLLLDVRQPWESDLAKLTPSLLVPLPQLDERWPEVGAAQAQPDRLIVAYCHHGVRSLSAAAILEAHGVGPVVSLAGGIDAWSRVVDPALHRY